MRTPGPGPARWQHRSHHPRRMQPRAQRATPRRCTRRSETSSGAVGAASTPPDPSRSRSASVCLGCPHDLGAESDGSPFKMPWTWSSGVARGSLHLRYPALGLDLRLGPQAPARSSPQASKSRLMLALHKFESMTGLLPRRHCLLRRARQLRSSSRGAASRETCPEATGPPAIGGRPRRRSNLSYSVKSLPSAATAGRPPTRRGSPSRWCSWATRSSGSWHSSWRCRSCCCRWTPGRRGSGSSPRSSNPCP